MGNIALLFAGLPEMSQFVFVSLRIGWGRDDGLILTWASLGQNYLLRCPNYGSCPAKRVELPDFKFGVRVRIYQRKFSILGWDWQVSFKLESAAEPFFYCCSTLNPPSTF